MVEEFADTKPAAGSFVVFKLLVAKIEPTVDGNGALAEGAN